MHPRPSPWRPILVLAACLTVGGGITAALTAALTSPAAAQDATPDDPITIVAPGVSRTVLSQAWPDDLEGDAQWDRLELARYVVAPGATIPAHTRPGDEVAYVERGALTVTTLAPPDGPDATTDAGDGPGVLHREMYGEGRAILLAAGDIEIWENQTTRPTVILTAALLRGDEPAVQPYEPSPSPTPEPSVRKRLALTGEGPAGDYRISIHDRSGHLRSARLPTAAEVRFAGGDPVSVGYGEHRTPVLVTWEGTPCGPVVDLDIAADLSEVRLTDRTPGCDASAVAHRVVLVFDAAADPYQMRLVSRDAR